MRTLDEFINSGILELYVLGQTTAAESAHVEAMCAAYPEVSDEVEAISKAMEQYAMAHAVEPDVTIKPLLMATLDYTERLAKGEQPASPPILSEGVRIDDFNEWLQRADMVLPEVSDGIYAKIISYTPQALTAIIWINEMTPEEVHHDEHEGFLVVEGTCDIIVEDITYSLVPGDYFSIPLHKNHMVKVTSDMPCKIILQRLAA